MSHSRDIRPESLAQHLEFLPMSKSKLERKCMANFFLSQEWQYFESGKCRLAACTIRWISHTCVISQVTFFHSRICSLWYHLLIPDECHLSRTGAPLPTRYRKLPTRLEFTSNTSLSGQTSLVNWLPSYTCELLLCCQHQLDPKALNDS